MNSFSSVASALQPRHRQELAINVLSKQESVSQIAKQEQVSRKFLYQQKAIAEGALNNAFEQKEPENEVPGHKCLLAEMESPLPETFR